LGWLDAWASASLLRDSFGSNNGMIDLGGAGVLHLVGGLSALIGALLVGPRAGRFDEEGKARDIYSGNAALKTVGALLVWIGFYGITCGRTLMLSDGNANIAAKVAVNVTIAAAASSVFAVLISLFVTNKFELTMALQGLISGLVAVSGGAHVFDPWMSFLIGAIAAVVLYAGQSLLLLLRIDDSCDTAVVHGLALVFCLPALASARRPRATPAASPRPPITCRPLKLPLPMAFVHSSRSLVLSLVRGRVSWPTRFHPRRILRPVGPLGSGYLLYGRQRPLRGLSRS
jgi:hypothetical protein